MKRIICKIIGHTRQTVTRRRGKVFATYDARRSSAEAGSHPFGVAAQLLSFSRHAEDLRCWAASSGQRDRDERVVPSPPPLVVGMGLCQSPPALLL